MYSMLHALFFFLYSDQLLEEQELSKVNLEEINSLKGMLVFGLTFMQNEIFHSAQYIIPVHYSLQMISIELLSLIRQCRSI